LSGFELERRSDVRRLYHTNGWRKVAKAVIRRDGYVCQIQRPGCTRIATTADHIVSPYLHGGSFFDPTNLRAACLFCNSGRGADRGPGPKITPPPPRREW